MLVDPASFPPATRTHLKPSMTVVIIGTFEVHRVAELAASLRHRGFTVLALESMSLVALVMLTERIVALVVHQDHAPSDWESARARLSQIGPTTRMLFVANDDPRTPEQLACESVSHLEIEL